MPEATTSRRRVLYVIPFPAGDEHDGRADRPRITAPIKSSAPGRHKIPLTVETLERLLESFRLPPQFANFSAAHTTVALDMDLHDSDLHAEHAVPETDRGSKGIICVLGPLAFAMSYCAVTQQSSAVVLGLCAHQASILEDHLRQTVQVLDSLMLLPILWLKIIGETRAHRVIGRKDALNRTEVDLGIHWGVVHPT